MIPKIIHYCWFGGNPLPELAQMCIASWKKYCPDYEIIEWNENNFDLDYCPYVREAYSSKKWAFVTDVVRLYALANFGGVYMDTDVEVVRSLDPLLQYEAVSGFESDTLFPTGLIASEPEQKFIKELLREYDNLHFIRENKELDLTTNVERISKAAKKYGVRYDNTLQTVAGFTILPKEYLCPKDSATRKLKMTDNTLCIHHFDGSWCSDAMKFKNVLLDKRLAWLPVSIGNKIATFIAITKYYSFWSAIKCSLLRITGKRFDF